MSHLTFGCTVASFAEVSWWFGVGDGDVQLRALKVIVGTVHRRGSALPCLLYERATFMNGPPHQLYPPTNSETTTPRRGDVIIQEAVRI